MENGITTGGNGNSATSGSSQPASQPASQMSLVRGDIFNENFTIIERIIMVKRKEDWKY